MATVRTVNVGDFAKLRFTDGFNTERMWVKVTHSKGGRLRGKLDNVPALLSGIRVGARVDVLSILRAR